MRVCWSVGEITGAIAGGPVTGPLAVRTVIVPSVRVGQAIRREMARTCAPAALVGTRFVTAAVLAGEVLEAAGVELVSGEEARRVGRVAEALRGGIALEYFDAALARETPGWEEAFARTIGELERAGLRAASLLEAATSARERDVAKIWAAVDASAGRSWTSARALGDAAARLRAGEGVTAIDDGPYLAVLTGGEHAAGAAFLQAIPRIQRLILGARPVSPAFLTRIETLWGAADAECIRAAEPPRAHDTRRAALASWLFEEPEVRAAAAAPAPPADETVLFEEHAGAEDELETAAEWVMREVLERRTPLGDIAILLPELDLLAAVLVARIARIPAPGVAVHVAGGLPLSATASGARALAILNALAEGLPPERLVDILPTLRARCDEATHLDRDDALRVLAGIGAIGARVDDDPRTPRRRIAERRTELEAEQTAPDTNPRANHRRRDGERLLALLLRVGPALDALFALDERVRAGDPLVSLAPALLAFLREHLLSPGEGPHVAERLAPAFEPLASGAPLAGRTAIRTLASTAARVRVAVGRFGEPAVYIGAIRDAAGIPFRAVRVIGLCEGAFPRTVHQDPVLPDTFRSRLSPSISLAAERPLADARALHRVILDARGTVVLSTPRTDFNRTTHEPSALFLDAAAALGRAIPSLAALRDDFFAPARASHAAFRAANPLGESGRLRRAAAPDHRTPASWDGAASLDRERLAALVAGAEDAAHGLLDPAHIPTPPGLAPERAISASKLGKLLQCPHKFLLEEVLRWDEPSELPSARDVGPLRYGSLFHDMLERFFQEHGAAFSRRENALARAEILPPFWIGRGHQVVGLALDELVRWYPLDEGALESHRLRLEHDVIEFLRHEWERTPARAFVAAERAFGYEPGPFPLPIGERRLYVHGFIDRLDIEDGATLVRDLKTGRPHPREGDEAGPTPVRDVQLALYGLVTRELAAEWGIPHAVGAAYSYAGPWGTVDRAFRGSDAADLFREGLAWLDLSLDLLETRAFPRSPLLSDCSWCSFRPVCGPDATDRSRERLELAPDGSPLSRFLELKRRQDGEDAA